MTSPMTVRAYAMSTSCVQGTSLGFVLDHPAPVVVTDATDDRVVFEGTASAPHWELDIPSGWRSSLYRARFGPEQPWPFGLPGTTPCPDNEVYFVVRQAVPGSPVLLSVPFTTWQAYNRAGEPGQSIYWTESPTRAARVTFDRPGGGPPPERWEEGLMRWLRRGGYDVAYCSNLDLHDGLDLLSRHRLLIVNGHDEYWSLGMRDAVEEFVRRGGNVAFFSGNTCWWQIRLEDGGRTMVCHRDPVTDPIAATDPRQTTVEWSAAPVNRPENTLTGVSFRAGAGAWGPHMPRMLEESYTTRFAAHWVFEGTGLTDGDKFGEGCLGYETDAAEFEEVSGVPRATGRDGTPSSFVVLATADLRHWSAYGQGGMATMGVFTSGLGTVFTAATVNWGNGLHDPVVDRITRNVVDRLSAAPGEERWDVIGPPADLRALAVLGRTLHAVSADGTLLARELCGQNLPWRPVGPADDVRALAVPREAAGGVAVGLYGVTHDGRLLRHDEPGWQEAGPAPGSAVGLAVADCTFWVATSCGGLWRRPFGGDGWEHVGSSGGAVALGGMNGRLFALDSEGRLLTRLPPPSASDWECHAEAVPGTMFTTHAGLVVAAGPGTPLRWRHV
ncbi:N,N-dimethylformamidase beta subunit family domain-containing protein [Microbispora sp. CSR-4]|uniref:N,N-dimethylformamidase beta subunit family domain-containing protein n=1 Tax=Microbispora sp. CSR-4 TaxID=2592813 RepID=UPI0021C9DC15|nr:N,N-dimethylformamidase beta subunit family domain-containing protein [Microbispora sp. CSR-4]